MAPDPLSQTLSALADPTRRAILLRLRGGDASVAELAVPFDMSVRAVSKHIGVLERAGLVSRQRDAQRRLSRLRSMPLKEVDDWLDAYRALWDARFDRMEIALQRMKGETACPEK